MPDVAREILTHFLSRPQVIDDLTGIARWRLLRQRMEGTVRETHYALEWLRKRGFLVAIDREAAGPLFRLNPERADEAASLLAGQEKRGN
jgi:hypothetical protein